MHLPPTLIPLSSSRLHLTPTTVTIPTSIIIIIISIIDKNITLLHYPHVTICMNNLHLRPSFPHHPSPPPIMQHSITIPIITITKCRFDHETSPHPSPASWLLLPNPSFIITITIGQNNIHLAYRTNTRARCMLAAGENGTSCLQKLHVLPC